MELTVVRKEMAGSSIAVLDLGAPDGATLPDWAPGSHIEVKLATGKGELVRQYSLCGAAGDRKAWRIAVLREANGRGGSAFICDDVKEGQHLDVTSPRNHFAFNPVGRVTFIAGGIGITPILPMVREAHRRGLDWRLIYLTRARSSMIFLDAIAELPAERVKLHCSSEAGRLDLAREVASYGEGDSIYACGPLRLLDDLDALKAESRAKWQLHVERFENPNKNSVTPNTNFAVVLAKSGRRFDIAPGESILEVLQRNGIDITASCREGVCSTCEQRVLDGIPDHRDAVLSPEERKQNNFMMICVSRSLTPSITLDL